MASWNSSIMLNNLIQEINNIGYYTGYLYNLISVNGAIISNNNTSVSTNNNNQYAYSSNNYLTTWTTQATAAINTDMFIGVSTDINQVFPGASTVSMQMINYGILIDNISNDESTIFLIKNGVVVFTIFKVSPLLTSTIKMSYANGTINFYLNNTILTDFTQTGLNLENVKLVIGGYTTASNGTLNNIQWSGTGGSSSGSQTLAETLQFGNDAGNLAIDNVLALTVNNNIECFDLGASYQVSAGNSVITPLINGINNDLAFSTDETKNKCMDIQIITGSNPAAGNPIVSLYNQNSSKIGQLFDTYFNTPMTNYTFGYSSEGPTGKIYPQVGKSILSFNLLKSYQSFEMNITTLNFNIDNNGQGGLPIIVQLYITPVLNGPFYKEYIGSYTTEDISISHNFTSTDNIILTYMNTNTSQTLYLNVYIANQNGGNYDLNQFVIAGEVIANCMPQIPITPALIMT